MIIADIHSHILPALDDGAKDLSTSIAMLEIAYRSGIRHIVATPHYAIDRYETDRREMYSRVELLKKELFLRDMNIAIYPGNEVRCATDVVQHFKNGQISTLNDAGFMLLELPFSIDIPNFSEMFFYIQAQTKTRVIFAHPERHSCVTSHPETVERMAERGILLQINADSLRGKNGKTAKAFVERLLKKGLVSFVASDCHSNIERKPILDDVYIKVRQKYGEKVAKKIFYENQMNILKGRAPV